jgi:hypothetical protein
MTRLADETSHLILLSSIDHKKRRNGRVRDASRYAFTFFAPWGRRP